VRIRCWRHPNPRILRRGTSMRTLRTSNEVCGPNGLDRRNIYVFWHLSNADVARSIPDERGVKTHRSGSFAGSAGGIPEDHVFVDTGNLTVKQRYRIRKGILFTLVIRTVHGPRTMSSTTLA